MPIFQDYHRTVVGYHGTREKTAIEIVSGKREFEPSRNDDDWLGHGVYFWEYAPAQAWKWARKRYQNEPIAVLGSMIRLGNCFDLLDPNNSKLLILHYRKLKKEANETGKSLKKNVNAKKYLDCRVFEYAYAAYDDEKEQDPPVDTTRAVYVPTQSKDRLWERSWLYHETHVQLSVRNTDCILGTWLVKPPVQ